MNKNFKILTTWLIAVLIFYFGYELLSNSSFFSNETYYNIKLEDASGIYTGQPVYYKGIRVGRIESVTLKDNDTIEAKLSFPQLFPIPKDSKIQSRGEGILGDIVMVLEKGESNDYLKMNDYIETAPFPRTIDSFKDEALTVIDKVTQLIDKVTDLTEKTSTIINPKLNENIYRSFSHMDSILTSMRNFSNRNVENINHTIKSINSITHRMDNIISDNEKQVNNMLSNTDSILTRTNQLIKNLNTVSIELTMLLETFNRKDGSAQQMLNDTTLIPNISNTLFKLNQLLIDMEKNPQKYLKNINLIKIF